MYKAIPILRVPSVPECELVSRAIPMTDRPTDGAGKGLLHHFTQRVQGCMRPTHLKLVDNLAGNFTGELPWLTRITRKALTVNQNFIVTDMYR